MKYSTTAIKPCTLSTLCYGFIAYHYTRLHVVLVRYCNHMVTSNLEMFLLPLCVLHTLPNALLAQSSDHMITIRVIWTVSLHAKALLEWLNCCVWATPTRLLYTCMVQEVFEGGVYFVQLKRETWYRNNSRAGRIQGIQCTCINHLVHLCNFLVDSEISSFRPLLQTGHEIQLGTNMGKFRRGCSGGWYLRNTLWLIP